MYIWIGIIIAISVFFAVRFYLLRQEVKRLNKQIGELSENSRYGRRLHLEENDNILGETVETINRMVDKYEGKLRRVEEMERNIRHSISGISHDLRTPITSLTGYLQLLSKETLTDKQREYLDTVWGSVITLRDLTENFYELSRLDLEDTAFSIQSINLEHIVYECFLGFYENFTQKNLELSIRDAEKPPVVLADEVALKRVLYNIAQNLLRYAVNTVSVSFFEENSFYAVTISNEAVEEIPDDIERVFERFYTADPSRKNRSMGIGLYVSRKLINGMGGSIIAYKDNHFFNIIAKLPKEKN